MTDNPYRAAGTFDGVSYVERKADTDLLAEIRENKRYVHFLQPRQSGKSSLIRHVTNKLDPKEFDIAVIDISVFPSQSFESYDEFLSAFVSEMFHSLGTPELSDVFRNNLRKAFEHIAKHRNRRVLIFLDEIDRILSTNFKDSFFSLIRWVYNQRSWDGDFAKVQFILSGAAHAKDLISKENLSPFNVGIDITLSDLPLEGVKQITSHLNGGKWEVNEDIARAVYKYTGGMIYLTQLVLERLWELAKDRSYSKITASTVDIVVEEIIEQSPSNIHFINIRETILNNPSLHKAFMRIITGGSVLLDEPSLQMIGIITGNRFRNPIYERVFGPSGPLSLFVSQSSVTAEWRPRRRLRRVESKEHTIGLWGPRGSGKTTFLLALQLALAADNNIRAVMNPEVNTHWEDLLESFCRNGELPGPSPYETSEFEIALERRGFFPIKKPKVAKIIVPDHAGEIWNVTSQDVYALDMRPEMVARLQEAEGIIFLIDPLAMFNRTSEEVEEIDTINAYKRPLQYIIRKMVLRKPGEEIAGSPIDAYCAVCITKCDLPQYYKHRQDPAKLAEQILGADIMVFLHNNIRRGHLSFFAISSIGRLSNSPNINELGNKLLSPGKLKPIGVMDPVVWIFDHIS